MGKIVWYVVYLFGIITVGYPHYLIGNIKVITNPQQPDGFGSQFQALIAAVIYAELYNKKFVYTPFQMMAHNYTDDPDFLAKKEDFINFINHFDTIDTVANNSNYSINSSLPYKAFFDTNVVAFANSRALKKIKRIFRENKNTHNYFNNKNLNIAIHIRRPNSHDNRVDGTNTPDAVFFNIIHQLRIAYSSKNPLFHIYSQGSSDNFKLFDASDIILHLNESLEDTFLSMVLADILVTGASSFSYTAGLLSEGIVYYIPFWHTPLPYWIPVDVLKKVRP